MRGHLRGQCEEDSWMRALLRCSRYSWRTEKTSLRKAMHATFLMSVWGPHGETRYSLMICVHRYPQGQSCNTHGIHKAQTPFPFLILTIWLLAVGCASLQLLETQ